MARALLSLASLSAIAALSCSDPAPVPPQGALYVVVSPGGSGSCNVGSNYSLPSGGDAVVAIRDYAGEDPSTGEVYRVVDGDKGVDVSCKVAVDSDNRVSFSARLAKSSSVSFTARGDITANGGTIYVAEWDNQTASNLSGDCELTPEVVADGAIYGDFSCPSFTDGELLNCAATGTFIFENCDE